MIGSYATGLIGMVAILAFWVFVQVAWRRAFPGLSSDGDVLAERVGCSGCERIEPCGQSASAGARDEEEKS